MGERVLSTAGLALVLAAALAAGARAQTSLDPRIDRLDKQVRELRAIVFQGRDTGQPVIVKPDGPDPAVEALGSKFDELQQAVRSLSGQVEELTHDLAEAKRQNAAAHDAETELRGEVKVLSDQVAKLQAPPAPAPSSPDAAPALPAASAPVSEATSFKAAKALLATKDYQAAGDALKAYLGQYPSSPRAREANYLLAEALFARNLYGDAISAYARALQDWPQTPWASEAVLNLAKALSMTKRADQACAALAEFDSRYKAKASKALKNRAAAAKARCD
jgi:tol-pal system protein YbgF